MEKHCRKCGEIKPLSEFHVNGTGVRCRCKGCENEKRVARYKPSAKRRIRLVTDTEAQCSRCGQMKPRSDFGKNNEVSLRSACNACIAERSKRYRAENRDKVLTAGRAFSRRYKSENREKITEYQRAYRQKNREKLMEQDRLYRERNLEKRRAYAASRRAAELQATPPWADLAAIEAVYAEAARVTRETGILHHVDHIVPLRGRSVCGLHVPWNLRPIPAADNASKLNREEEVDGVEYFRF